GFFLPLLILPPYPYPWSPGRAGDSMRATGLVPRPSRGCRICPLPQGVPWLLLLRVLSPSPYPPTLSLSLVPGKGGGLREGNGLGAAPIPGLSDLSVAPSPSRLSSDLGSFSLSLSSHLIPILGPREGRGTP